MRVTWSATSRRVSAGALATAIAMMLSGLRMSCATVAASEPSSARRACSWRSRSARRDLLCLLDARRRFGDDGAEQLGDVARAGRGGVPAR